jgi:serine/threonine-protein kinase
MPRGSPAERAIMDEQRILDRYRLIERIASGGSAEVWRAHDEQLDRPVAVKRLHPHLLPDETSRQRLAAEARAVASLTHPVIVGIYDVDVEGDWPALVMELVDGEPLGARIAREGPLDGRAAAAVGADLADALYHAHRQGVVHRDLKPGNVLLDREGHARLVDFGIAHSLEETSARLTQAGNVVGTLSAMAPEQLSGGEIGPRTDLYGLGVVLHEALTGAPPYPVTSPVALADAQRAGPPPMSDVDAALATLVRACLAHRIEDRPIHAGAVAIALRAWADGDAAPAFALASPAAAAAGTTAVTRVAPAAAPPIDEPAGPARAVHHRRSWRAGGVALAAAILVAAVVGAVLLGGALLPAAADPTGIASPTSSPTARGTPRPTATPTQPAPPPLTGWQAKLAEEYREECGRELEPSLIAGMQKPEAEQRVDELIEECRDDGD